MPNQMPVVEDNFDFTIPVNGVGERVLLLETTNKFVDKNIVIRTNTPAVGNASLSITDKGSTNIGIGTASGGYYPLTTSLSGTVNFASAGWVGTSVGPLTDETVTVGRIAQSTLQNGDTTISSGSTIAPLPTTTQTINIGTGLYNGARSVVIGAMSSGTKASGTTNATATAKTPTLVSEASAIGSKVQVTPDADVGIQTSSGNMTAAKYYMALRAATADLANSDFTKSANVSTAGYLGGVGTTSQIIASASVTGSNQLFYVPLTTGSVTVSGSKVATNPTVANAASSSITNKTQITASPTTGTSFDQTFYLAVKATAPATTISSSNMTKSITAGYVDSAEVHINDFTVSEKTGNTYYIPLATAVLKANASTVSANKGNLAAITNVSSAPTDGTYYFSVTGSGKTGVQSAGWIAAGDNLVTSTSATTYYTIPKATFTTSGNIIKSNTAGYIAADQQVATITSRSLRVSETDPGNGYTAKTNVIVPTGGYLVLDAGYYDAQKVSLATLIPDESTLTSAANIQLRQGYSAYDANGNLITGAMPEYDGTYTLT